MNLSADSVCRGLQHLNRNIYPSQNMVHSATLKEGASILGTAPSTMFFTFTKSSFITRKLEATSHHANFQRRWTQRTLKIQVGNTSLNILKNYEFPNLRWYARPLTICNLLFTPNARFQEQPFLYNPPSDLGGHMDNHLWSHGENWRHLPWFRKSFW